MMLEEEPRDPFNLASEFDKQEMVRAEVIVEEDEFEKVETVKTAVAPITTAPYNYIPRGRGDLLSQPRPSHSSRRQTLLSQFLQEDHEHLQRGIPQQ